MAKKDNCLNGLWKRQGCMAGVVRQNLPELAQTWLSGVGRRNVQAAARQLSQAYREGKSSSDQRINLQAYMASRLPATYAVIVRVLGELAALRPGWSPQSVVDLGAGPGTASWAAAETWPSISSFELFDTHAGFLEVANALAQQSPLPALSRAKILKADFVHGAQLGQADLVMAAYSFIEMEAKDLSLAAPRAWQAARSALVLIEPGTPVAFERLRSVRRQLIGLGAHILAPCPGDGECPITSPDWCHFAQRLNRSRLHKHAKAASVPYEDEKFCYLVAVRRKEQRSKARIVKPVRRLKHGLQFQLCGPLGLEERLVAKRDKPAYGMFRKQDWGDTLPVAAMEGKNDGA